MHETVGGPTHVGNRGMQGNASTVLEPPAKGCPSPVLDVRAVLNDVLPRLPLAPSRDPVIPLLPDATPGCCLTRAAMIPPGALVMAASESGPRKLFSLPLDERTMRAGSSSSSFQTVLSSTAAFHT